MKNSSTTGAFLCVRFASKQVNESWPAYNSLKDDGQQHPQGRNKTALRCTSRDGLAREPLTVLNSRVELNSNMSAMSESLKHLNNMGQRNDTQAASASKKPRLLPESSISSEVNDLMDGQVPQDKLSKRGQCAR